MPLRRTPLKGKAGEGLVRRQRARIQASGWGAGERAILAVRAEKTWEPGGWPGASLPQQFRCAGKRPQPEPLPGASGEGLSVGHTGNPS